MKWLNGYKIRFVLVGFIAVIVFSPCIDAGDPSNSVAFEPYPNGGTVEASQSPSGLHSKYGGGTGVPNDPYLIYAAEHLNALGAETGDYDKHFKLMADIDLSGYTYDKAVIAPDLNDDKDSLQGTTFTGVFDGNGHTISHLTIEGGGFLGLFGQIGLSGRHESGATVSNLGLEAVDVSGMGDHVGGLVGLMNHEDGSIINCYSTGMVTGGEYVGGLVGSSKRGGRITASYSTGTVTGDKFVGGLVGCNGSSVMFQATLRTPPSRVAACFSNSMVTGGECVGGLVGVNYDTGSIVNSYSTGVVSGDDNVGGLVGGGDIPQFWFRGGDSALVTHCVWDMETSGQMASAAGAGLTTGEMMDPYMLGLNGFANDPNWVLDDGHDYPRLAWEGTPGQIIPKPEIDWLEGQGTAEIPYKIDTADQLIFLGQAASALWDKHFVLAADIDLNPDLPGRKVFSRAVFQVFLGVFDGNDHKISHLTILGDSYLGLFGQLGPGAIISNLVLEAADIKGTGSHVGNLAGRNRGSISDCFSSALVSGNQLVGGLVGENYGEGSITSCYNTGAVTGDIYVGGLVGRNGYWAVSGLPWMPLATATRVANCFSNSTVTGGECVGGLVGMNFELGGKITNSYSTGLVSGDYVGGLVGGSSRWGGSITSSFWDIVTTGLSEGTGGVGLTTAEMQTASTFLDAGWDFVDEAENGTENIWWINEGQDYPRLWWEEPTTIIIMAPYGGGSGEPNDPYIIGTAEELLSLGRCQRDYGKHFILTADIDLNPNLPGREFLVDVVIAPQRTSFTGVFDGNGHTISNLTVGLFGSLGPGGEVRDLSLVDVNICSDKSVGGLSKDNSGIITNCYSTGTITGGELVGGLVGTNSGSIVTSYSSCTVNGNESVGGLVGENNMFGSVTISYSTGSVNGGSHSGGLVGSNYGNVIQCHSTGSVKGTGCGIGGLLGSNHAYVIHCYSTGMVGVFGQQIWNIGGFVGDNSGRVTQCYSTGNVSATSELLTLWVGGLMGGGNNGEVIQCYSTGLVSTTGQFIHEIGGLVGRCSTVTYSAWNIETSGLSESAGGVGLTTAEMHTAATFLEAGWDFVDETANGTEDIWWINEGQDYPRLWWEVTIE